MWILFASLAAEAAPMEFTYTGRVLDAAGGPLEGTHTITVEMFDGSGAGATSLYRETFSGVPVEQGYFQVVLGAGTQPLDGTVLSSPEVWVEVSVDGAAPFAPRQKLASTPYSGMTSRIPVVDTNAIGACADPGLIVWDTTIEGFRVCDGTTWQANVAARVIVSDGTTRRWSDGTYAASCNGYRHPTAPGYVYAGATVDVGTYAIDPDGDGVPIDVVCDMVADGGGYTYYAVSNGTSTCRFTDANSCPAGMDIVMPRSKAHWQSMVARFGATYFEVVPGVYDTTNGGNYTGCIMRDPNTYGSGCNDWRVGDGGAWWIRDTSFSEPNGDYVAYCWLGLTKASYAIDSTVVDSGIKFNDATSSSCLYCTTNYICSTNDK